MRQVLQLISWLALAATILPSAFFLAGQVSLDNMKWLMLGATIVWFIVTPMWMGREADEGPLADEVVVP